MLAEGAACVPPDAARRSKQPKGVHVSIPIARLNHAVLYVRDLAEMRTATKAASLAKDF